MIWFKKYWHRLLILIIACAPSISLAAGGGGDHPAKIDGIFIWKVVNFSLLCSLLFYVLKKPVKNLLSAKRDQIKKALEKAEKIETEATKLLRECEERLANIDKEREQILSRAQEQGEHIKKEIITAAEAYAEQILKNANNVAEHEKKMMQKRLAAELAEQVYAQASEALKSKVDQNKDNELITEFVRGVQAR